jgi:hypothetical protein
MIDDTYTRYRYHYGHFSLIPTEKRRKSKGY